MSSEFDNGTPARVHRPTGIVELAPSFFQLTPDQRRFVLLHEVGHYALNTRSEYDADAWAAGQMQKDVGLKRTFRAMNGALRTSPASDSRRVALFNRMVMYDNRLNGNDMKTIGPCVYMTESDVMQPYRVLSFDGEDGFTFNNNFIPSDINTPAYPVEAPEFVRWCQNAHRPCSNTSLSLYRKAKAKAWSNYQQLPSGVRVGYDPNAIDVTDIKGERELTGPDGKPIFVQPPQPMSESENNDGTNKGVFGMFLFLAAVAAVAYIVYKNL